MKSLQFKSLLQSAKMLLFAKIIVADIKWVASLPGISRFSKNYGKFAEENFLRFGVFFFFASPKSDVRQAYE